MKIHHNYSEGNQGFLEVTNSGSNLDISYNVSNDYQNFIFFWDGDSSRVENNTVLRTKPANSSVNVVFTFKNNGYVIRNNIFVVANELQVFAGGAYDALNFDQVHENNLYFTVDSRFHDPIRQPLGRGEFIADPMFVDLERNDFRLRANSPAIDAGEITGNYRGCAESLDKRVDMGALEFFDLKSLIKN